VVSAESVEAPRAISPRTVGAAQSRSTSRPIPSTDTMRTRSTGVVGGTETGTGTGLARAQATVVAKPTPGPPPRAFDGSS
jgi:hypothetical protein